MPYNAANSTSRLAVSACRYSIVNIARMAIMVTAAANKSDEPSNQGVKKMPKALGTGDWAVSSLKRDTPDEIQGQH